MKLSILARWYPEPWRSLHSLVYSAFFLLAGVMNPPDESASSKSLNGKNLVTSTGVRFEV
jgi:hypothetical protein